MSVLQSTNVCDILSTNMFVKEIADCQVILQTTNEQSDPVVCEKINILI